MVWHAHGQGFYSILRSIRRRPSLQEQGAAGGEGWGGCLAVIQPEAVERRGTWCTNAALSPLGAAPSWM